MIITLPATASEVLSGKPKKMFRKLPISNDASTGTSRFQAEDEDIRTEDRHVPRAKKLRGKTVGTADTKTTDDANETFEFL
jgi:hypothetical protein